MVTTDLISLPRTLVILSLILTLGGCVNEEFDDLKDFVAQVKAKPAKPIPPMPVIKSYESYNYVA